MGSFIRLLSDGPPKTLCPHLLALRVGKYVQLSVEDLIILLIDPFSNYVIEFWVEKKRLVGNLDLAEGMAAFFPLVFVFNLEYPVVNELITKIFLINNTILRGSHFSVILSRGLLLNTEAWIVPKPRKHVSQLKTRRPNIILHWEKLKCS